jgi:hypothetical protein
MAQNFSTKSTSKGQAAAGSLMKPRSWPYVRTPLSIYLIVMLPICALELFLIANRAPAWMTWTAGGVVVISAAGFFRGYLRRLVLDSKSARLWQPGRGIAIQWSDVRHVGVYVPGGGLGATAYLYITTRETIPQGKWDIDEATIQVQDRDGLREVVETFRRGLSEQSRH